MLNAALQIPPGQGAGMGQDGASAPSSISLTFPCPPSVNEAFRNVRGKGRVRTEAYNDWASHASWVIRSQRPGSMRGNCVVMIGIDRVSARADIDNRLKLSLDMLVKEKVIEDDRFVTAIAMTWNPPANKIARVTILPVQAMALAFQPSPDGASGGWFIAPSQET